MEDGGRVCKDSYVFKATPCCFCMQQDCISGAAADCGLQTADAVQPRSVCRR